MVNRFRAEFRPCTGVAPEAWPNIADRFRDIGEESGYRTVYARLCSQSHGDAEETLRYFIGVSSGNQKLIEKMSIETTEFSRLMVFLAASFFLSAVGKYAVTFEMTDLAVLLLVAQQDLDRAMKAIALELYDEKPHSANHSSKVTSEIEAQTWRFISDDAAAFRTGNGAIQGERVARLRALFR
jgi:hypothetical protein